MILPAPASQQGSAVLAAFDLDVARRSRRHGPGLEEDRAYRDYKGGFSHAGLRVQGRGLREGWRMPGNTRIEFLYYIGISGKFGNKLRKSPC